MSDEMFTATLLKLRTEMAGIRRRVEELASRPSMVRARASADAAELRQIELALSRATDEDDVIAALSSPSLYNSDARKRIAALRQQWSGEGPDVEDILDDGDLVAYQDWDSGGPGAGAGRVSVYEYDGAYYGMHDAGLEGPFTSFAEAASSVGLYVERDATRKIWPPEASAESSKPGGAEVDDIRPRERADEAFVFRGTRMEGPDVDITSLAGLDLTEAEQEMLWDAVNERDLLLSCPCVTEIEEDTIDDAPGLSDSYYRYEATSREDLIKELREAIQEILHGR